MEGPAPTRAHNQRVAVVKSIGERLAYVKAIMSPLFTYDWLCLLGGVLGGALEVQDTQSVCFPLSHEQLQDMVAFAALG